MGEKESGAGQRLSCSAPLWYRVWSVMHLEHILHAELLLSKEGGRDRE